MVADGMLTRKRYREVPPRVDYELTERAQQLMPVLAELARWGYEWAWSAPRSTEAIDVQAIFRLAPGLAERAGASGVVEFTITDGSAEREPLHCTFTLTPERVEVAEQAAEEADARVSGDRAAWISAFSPERDRRRLELSGERELAERLLDCLAPLQGGSRRSATAVA
jgi:hypothetical protein